MCMGSCSIILIWCTRNLLACALLNEFRKQLKSHFVGTLVLCSCKISRVMFEGIFFEGHTKIIGNNIISFGCSKTYCMCCTPNQPCMNSNAMDTISYTIIIDI